MSRLLFAVPGSAVVAKRCLTGSLLCLLLGADAYAQDKPRSSRWHADSKPKKTSYKVKTSGKAEKVLPKKGDSSDRKTPVTAQTIVELQPNSAKQSVNFGGSQAAGGSATLINLNVDINSWYVLKVKWPGDSREALFHIENVDSARTSLALDPQDPTGLVVQDGTTKKTCKLFVGEGRDGLIKASRGGAAFVSLCDDKIVLRNRVDGRKTTKEWVTEFLRDNVWGGEEITTFVKDKLYKDKFLITGDGQSGTAEVAASGDKAPLSAKVSSDQLLVPSDLGLSTAVEKGGKLLVGRWYESRTQDGVFVSMIEPNFVSKDILESHKALVNKLDAVEGRAVSYLVAFDLADFDLAFAMGTDHPGVQWSPRPPAEMKDTRAGGPDGFATWAPLVTTGMVSPAVAGSVVATFTGGFKRDHGAMKWGSLAYANKGSHYGFIENGVIFSSLNPGLSTLLVTRDGAIDMRVWSEADAASLSKVRYARQNGVPLIEADDKTGEPAPGKLVRQWGPGNWSGSADSNLRTLRAGVCLQQTPTKTFLIYGYFSTATPSAMARVFQAYQCKFAMHMDMNAFEHTYLAVNGKSGNNLSTEPLVKGMGSLDKTVGNRSLPRFLGFSDNRDFFYLTRKKK